MPNGTSESSLHWWVAVWEGEPVREPSTRSSSDRTVPDRPVSERKEPRSIIDFCVRSAAGLRLHIDRVNTIDRQFAKIQVSHE